MRLQPYFIILLKLCLGFSMVLYSARAGATVVPPDAVSAARSFLEYSITQAEKDSDWFTTRWRVKIDDPSTLRLGSPYRIYRLNKPEITRFADGQDLVSDRSLYGYGFPVFDDSLFVGTIRVANEGGSWKFVGRDFLTDHIDLRILALQEIYTTKSGYSVGTATSRQLGVYIFVFENNAMRYITPAVRWTADLMSIAPSNDDVYPLVEYDKLKHKLVEKAKEIARMENNN